MDKHIHTYHFERQNIFLCFHYIVFFYTFFRTMVCLLYVLSLHHAFKGWNAASFAGLVSTLSEQTLEMLMKENRNSVFEGYIQKVKNSQVCAVKITVDQTEIDDIKSTGNKLRLFLLI